MAVDTENPNFLAVHLDKVAYGTAAVLGLVILLIPMFSTGDLSGAIRRADELQDKCKDRLACV